MDDVTNPEQEVMTEDQLIDGIADLLEEPNEENAVVEGEEAKEEDEKAEEDEPKEEEKPEETEADFLELERLGQVKKVSKEEAKKLAQMGWDYTEKTQELSIRAKAVDRAQEEALQIAQEAHEYGMIFSKVIQVDGQLEQYKQVDWDTWSDNDPAAAQKAYFQFQKLKDLRQELHAQANQKAEQLRHAKQQKEAKLLQEGQVRLSEEFKDWGAQKQKEFIDYGLKIGAREDTLARLNDPALIIALNKARLYDELQSKKTLADKRVQSLPKVIKPGAAQPVSKKQASQDKLKRFKRSGSQEDAMEYLMDIL